MTNSHRPHIWLPIVISTFALLISALSAYYQYQSLTSAQSAWESQQGKAEIESFLRIWDTKEGEYVSVKPNSNIPDLELVEPFELYGKIEVTNTGGSQIGINSAGFMKSENQGQKIDRLLCPSPDEDDDSMVTCNTPIKIDSLSRQVILIHLGKYLNTDLQCNDYIESTGVQLYVETTSKDIIIDAASNGLGAASYCPEMPRAADGTSK